VGPEEPRKYNHHFKLMVTVGEPIEPDVWRWYYEEVGKREAIIVDTWWQTENGGFLCSTKPALDPMKPGSTGPGVPGINPVVLDENGKELPPGSQKAGNICIRNPWPGIMQTIWGDPDRYVQTYYAKYCKNPTSKDWHDWPYFAGDGALYAADGYIRILGRVDDVINVAGHRLGTKELESACLTVEGVAEAAVVPTIDAIKGRLPEVYVSLKPDAHRSEESVRREIQASIEDLIGKFARPKQVWIVEDMPKTRSGKIMRRVLAAVSNRMPVGDVTTLANPEVVERIKSLVESRSEAPHHADAGSAEDIRRFGQND
jgi:acetyl-CoA synthetase